MLSNLNEKRAGLRARKEERWRRVFDESANAITHGAGFVLSIGGLVILMWQAIGTRDATGIFSAAVYGLSLVLLYGVSTLYHTVRNPRRKLKWRLLDHCSIYILIAGSYTPFMLVSVGGWTGWTVFSVIWGIAIAGILMKVFVSARATRFSTLLYGLMGWGAVVVAKPLWDSLTLPGLYLMFVGGLFYTVGIVFFVRDFKFLRHAAWHSCVLAGSAVHFLVVILDVY